MIAGRSDRWRPTALAVVLHALLAGALLWRYWLHHRPSPPQPQAMAIEATVVDPSRLSPLPAQPAPDAAPAAEPEQQHPPRAEPRKAGKAAAKAEARDRKKAERLEKAEKAKAEAAKVEAEKVAKAEAEKARSRAKADAAKVEKARQDADRKAKEDTERQARDKAATERLTAQREAELRARMAAEERFTSAKAAGLLAQYQAQIRASIERAWIRPPSARPGLECEMRITQVAGGEVVGVQVGRCNGDEAVRQSIEAAAYRASPLPQPSDPALFDRSLVVTFRPQE
ncbi:MAG: hypothetical protein RLZZ393_737 [Pseudomonadota bacterium]|jgi:colicin import membrane protein